MLNTQKQVTKNTCQTKQPHVDCNPAVICPRNLAKRKVTNNSDITYLNRQPYNLFNMQPFKFFLAMIAVLYQYKFIIQKYIIISDEHYK